MNSQLEHSSEYHNRAEKYEFTTEKWSRVAPYPFFEDISLAPVVSYDAGFIVFGGYVRDKGQLTETDLIAMFKNEKWLELGSLYQQKRGHGVIIRDNTFWVVGGTAKATVRQETTSETCSYDQQSIQCQPGNLQLSSAYSFYPEMFLIDVDMCSHFFISLQ